MQREYLFNNYRLLSFILKTLYKEKLKLWNKQTTVKFQF